MSDFSLTWRGKELRGWRWWIALIGGAIGTLIVAVVGFAVVLLLAPLGGAVRVVTGKWPPWFRFEKREH